jgi:hypothetical protein
MSYQNIRQFTPNNNFPMLSLETYDMSLTSDEQNYNEEVVFSPYIIAQTYGDRLPFYFDINSSATTQNITLTFKSYNFNNIFVSENYYNPDNLNLSCEFSGSSCDIGLTGIDNGLVTGMTDETIVFTNGLLPNNLKFDRLFFDRRLKLHQVTGFTSSNVRFSGFNKTILYEVVSKENPFYGKYHELYGGFYQGFYKLFGFDYDIFPERMNKGWSVELLLKPRLVNEFSGTTGETTLNEIYPNNKNIFFYIGTRAENKFYHHADGSPICTSGYTRVTSGLTTLQTCACCNYNITNSRCIYVYPPRSVNGIHDPHLNYGCDKCGGNHETQISCGCGCNELPCQTCGWECQTHYCSSTIPATPTPTPTPSPTPSCNPFPPQTTCTPTCTDCVECHDCNDCTTSGFTSIEDTCEKNPLLDTLSNALAIKLCGDPKNPGIGIRFLRFTGGCEMTGTCTTGMTYETGYTITEICTPPIYPDCEQINPAWLDDEHWFQVDVVWERYNYFDTCDLFWRGGLGDITKKLYLEGLANNAVSLIAPPYTRGEEALQVELINLNEKWLIDGDNRLGRLKIYINGKIFYIVENFEEIIPRALNTDKEKQVGVPFNISWGGGTQGLRENLTFSSITQPYGPYIQDPECFPNNDLSGTTLSGLNTNILIEQNFAGTFEGAISQFRMYVSPLSAPEVKHNFGLLKNQFMMFNPDCPDCTTIVCAPDDFTYVVNVLSPTPTPTITVTSTPRPTVTPTPTISVTPTISLTPTNTPRPTRTPTRTPTPTPTPSSTNCI